MKEEEKSFRDHLNCESSSFEVRRIIAVQLHARLEDARRLAERFKEEQLPPGSQSRQHEFYRGMVAAYSNALQLTGITLGDLDL